MMRKFFSYKRLFGNRFMPDQTLYEYLIEFLLVFVSAKDSDLKTGKMKFHNNSDNRLEYWIEPRMGLRRFIFMIKQEKMGLYQLMNMPIKKYSRY